MVGEPAVALDRSYHEAVVTISGLDGVGEPSTVERRLSSNELSMR
jgi:hypothetical protein